MTARRDAGFDTLLAFLRRSRGIDLSGYKRPTLQRRMTRRMRVAGASDYAEYLDRLESDPAELPRLLDTILINVTSFFRDWPAWVHLRREVLPRILPSLPRGAPIRVWSAGCATGEEAWSLAIAISEEIPPESPAGGAVIYASDADEGALETARAARYDAESLTTVPEQWRRRYFTPSGNLWTVRDSLRAMVVFGRHDLTTDAPIQRADLIACRNTLMYFDGPTQVGILRRFHHALQPAGALFLGEAEMLTTLGGLFRAVDPAHRIFMKAAGAAQRAGVEGRPGP